MTDIDLDVPVHWRATLPTVPPPRCHLGLVSITWNGGAVQKMLTVDKTQDRLGFLHSSRYATLQVTIMEHDLSKL